MAELQTQDRALSNLQARPRLTSTGFPQFGRLAQEIQNSIWKEALQAEAQKIVLHDVQTGGIYLSQNLVSSISKVNSAAYTIATEFYNVKLDVFACDLDYSSLSRPRRHLKGAVRLNLDYATMIVGFCPQRLLHEDGWWNIGLPEDSEGLEQKLMKTMCEEDVYEVYDEYYHIWAKAGRPCQDDLPGWVTNCHVTGELTESDRAQVRRTVQLIRSSRVQQPHCCWNCDFSRDGLGGDYGCTGDFPNVAFCRLLVAKKWRHRHCGAYTLDQLLHDCANLRTADWWDSIKSGLMLCSKHENINGEKNENATVNNADENIENADEDAADEDSGDNAVDNANENAADENTIIEVDAEENNVNKDDAGKDKDKVYKKLASICAREDKSFFF